MLKKVIKCTDYNGVEREETHYFNLNKAELMEMELGTVGGFSDMVQKIIEANDTPTLIKIFKDIIIASYGEKSPDGKAFIKVDDNGVRLANKFVQSEAYSELFMELATNAEAAAAFINGIVPSEVAKEAEKNGTLTAITGA